MATVYCVITKRACECLIDVDAYSMTFNDVMIRPDRLGRGSSRFYCGPRYIFLMETIRDTKDSKIRGSHIMRNRNKAEKKKENSVSM